VYVLAHHRSSSERCGFEALAYGFSFAGTGVSNEEQMALYLPKTSSMQVENA
jgi:hypothetical protein